MYMRDFCKHVRHLHEIESYFTVKQIIYGQENLACHRSILIGCDDVIYRFPLVTAFSTAKCSYIYNR